MTFWEVIVTGTEPDEQPLLIIDGRTRWFPAVSFLDSLAKAGKIDGSTAVDEYSTVHVSGQTVLDLLEYIAQRIPADEPATDEQFAAVRAKAVRVRPDAIYRVYISTV